MRSAIQPAGTTSLEGLTWPDTYFIGEQQTDEDILRTIVTAFDEHAAAAGVTSYDTVKIASLVQAESTAEDAPQVSAVIANRLQRGMQLQIDATLCYAKGGCPPVPNNADKQIDSPYNTYKVFGLPPTPIMTVTEPALAAAAHPADVAVPLLRHRQGRCHPVRDDARRPRAEHPRARGERRVKVTGSTRLAAVIGDPIRHSRSPAIHNAAFAAAGLDWVFVAFEVPPGSGSAAVKAVHSLGLGGMSVTMPHKQDAAWACDELTPEAIALGAVNAIVPIERGRTHGASTDGEGFLRSLRDQGIDPGAVSSARAGSRRRGAGDHARARAGRFGGHGRGAPEGRGGVGRRSRPRCRCRAALRLRRPGRSTSW